MKKTYFCKDCEELMESNICTSCGETIEEVKDCSSYPSVGSAKYSLLSSKDYNEKVPFIYNEEIFVGTKIYIFGERENSGDEYLHSTFENEFER